MNQRPHQGEFRSDVTRDTFDPTQQFSRVLMQQGRPLLDADWNEQTSILLHYLQTLATDLIGPHGGPTGDAGFQVSSADAGKNFTFGKGRYYVDGMLCENDVEGISSPAASIGINESGKDFFLYLDVWEEHVNADQDGSIHEVALGDVDTATRAKVVWQVKALKLEDLIDKPTGNPVITSDEANHLRGTDIRKQNVAAGKIIKNKLALSNRGSLRARAKQAETKTEPCNIAPDASFRGAENQLYRVEIHKGGTISDQPTFKWSRDNSSIVFPILTPSGNQVTLAHLGKDATRSLKAGDWVEFVDDDSVRRESGQPLLQVEAIDPVDQSVTLNLNGATLPAFDQAKHPLLRRWDHFSGDPKQGGSTLNGGAALIIESPINTTAPPPDNEIWLKLEDGVEIHFVQGATPHQYRAGDYWLIPARVATGDVEWPGEVNNPTEQPPHGVQHHYAPLAVIQPGAAAPNNPIDLRRKFSPLPPSAP